ncbi:MAG: PepSY-like domain-containing protein, partial [Bacteroidales bacterium]
MKTKILTLLCMIMLGGLMFSCSKDDDNDIKSVDVPSAVMSAFNEAYPNTSAKWSLNDNYYVAEFGNDKNEIDVWFTSDGTIMLTVKEIPVSSLPQAIKTAIQGTKYATWTIDDANLIQRKGFDDLYKVEADDPKSDSEVTLYYTATGVLIKEVPEIDNTPITPVVVPQKMIDQLNLVFPAKQYKIVDFDYESSTKTYEIDIIEQNIAIEVIFNNSQILTYWQWETTFAEVAPNVKAAFKGLGYTESQIDDIYFRQTPNATPAENKSSYVF